MKRIDTECEGDLGSDEHYLSSSENKANRNFKYRK